MQTASAVCLHVLCTLKRDALIDIPYSWATLAFCLNWIIN